MSHLEEVRTSFVALWGSLGTFWGVAPTTARVYGYLLSRSEPADAEEIMAALDLSRGAVSMACRELRDWALVHDERAAGSRRVLYRPEADLERVVRHVLQIRKRREWDPILENLNDWIPRLETERSDDAKVFHDRMRAIEALIVLANSLAESFLRGGTVGRIGLKTLTAMAKKKRPVPAMTGPTEPALTPGGE